MSPRKRVYICFEYAQDKGLKDLLVGQANNENSPFEIVDGSLHEAVPEKEWAEKARARIGKADIVMVLTGASTYRAPGVLEEIRIARELGKRVIQLVGHKDQRCPRVPGGGILYRWTWENLKHVFDKERA